jgi:hypothetical protein
VGDSRDVSLNQRLFNSVSLLNAVTNIGGIPALLLLKDPAALVAVNLGTGLIFAAFYGRSRFGGCYRPLYWPFVLTILVFLFANMLLNAGSAGGAVWYLVPALVIATALAPSARTSARLRSAAGLSSVRGPKAAIDMPRTVSAACPGPARSIMTMPPTLQHRKPPPEEALPSPLGDTRLIIQVNRRLSRLALAICPCLIRKPPPPRQGPRREVRG